MSLSHKYELCCRQCAMFNVIWSFFAVKSVYMNKMIFCILSLLIIAARCSQAQTTPQGFSEDSLNQYELSSSLLLHHKDLIYTSVLSRFKYGWPAGAASFPS